jgi:hypothetical protein
VALKACHDPRPSGLGEDTPRIGFTVRASRTSTPHLAISACIRYCGPDVRRLRRFNGRPRVWVKFRKHNTQNLLQLRRAAARVLGGVCVHDFEQIDEGCQKRIGDRRFAGMSTQELAITKHALDEFNLVGGEFFIIE